LDSWTRSSHTLAVRVTAPFAGSSGDRSHLEYIGFFVHICTDLFSDIHRSLLTHQIVKHIGRTGTALFAGSSSDRSLRVYTGLFCMCTPLDMYRSLLTHGTRSSHTLAVRVTAPSAGSSGDRSVFTYIGLLRSPPATD